MNIIADFQNYMQTSPLGIVYAAPENGVMDNDLLSAIQKLECKMAEILNNKSIKGSIISSAGKIKTTVEDVKKSVNIVSNFQKYAQATLETLDVALNDPEKPASLQPILNPGAAESQLERDPILDQQLGKSQITPPKTALDDRFIKLVEIFKKG